MYIMKGQTGNNYIESEYVEANCEYIEINLNI